MFRALWFLLKLGVFTAAVVWLAEQPGTASFHWRGYVVETSVGFLTAVLLALLGIYTALYRVWSGFADMPNVWRRYRDFQKREQGYQDVTSGFIAVAAGDAANAGKCAARATQALPSAPLAKLLSAQTYLLKGESQKARHVFAELLRHEPAAIFGARGLLQDSLRAGDLQAALGHIRDAESIQPGRAWIVKTLFDLETRNREWPRAQSALQKASRLGVFTPREVLRKQQALYLARADAVAAKGEMHVARRLAAKAFALDAGFPPAAERLAKFCDATEYPGTAIKALIKAWAARPHPALAVWWTHFAPEPRRKASPYDRGKDVVLWAQRLANANPDHLLSAKILGEASLTARQWSEARAYLTRAMDYRGLARLEKEESGNEAKAREWLEIFSDAPVESKWVCISCGHAQADWVALCPHCGVFDQAEWTNPEQASARSALDYMHIEDAPQALFIAPDRTTSHKF